MKYRPEIDGLRAIAVLSVLFYHAEIFFWGVNPFKGGFIGVDVFFVISGYLITLILLKELNANKFSLTRYYERRARRILPVLFFVMLVTIPLGIHFLTPEPLKEFGKSLLASTLFSSNFLFYKLGGYADQPNALKPFLHTWSLSVEEQFYLVFPATLYFLWRFSKKSISLLLITGSIFSLILAQWGAQHHPDAAFYFFPTRAWELLIGGVLAELEYNGKCTSQRALTKIFPFIGLMLIVYATVVFRETMLHPGFITLIPVSGTCLIIWFARGNDPISKLLSTKFFVGIGLISYSLYLWHTPILAFARISSINAIDNFAKISCLLLSAILAFFSWYFIEGPFRDYKKIKTKTIVTVLSVTSIFIMFFGIVFAKTNYFSAPMPLELGKIWKREYQEEALRQNGLICNNLEPAQACRFGPVDAKTIWYVNGDSHAAVLAPSLYEKIDFKNQALVNFTNPGCFYAPGLWREKNNDSCHDRNIIRRKILLSSKPGFVIMNGRLPLYLNMTGYDNGEGGVELRNRTFLTYNSDLSEPSDSQLVKKYIVEAILELIKYGHTVVLVYPVPETGWHVTDTYMKMLQNKESAQQLFSAESLSTSYKNFLSRTKSSYELLDSVGEHKNLLRVYPEKIFCNKIIKDRCVTHDAENIYYADYTHLSKAGAVLVVDEILRTIYQR